MALDLTKTHTLLQAYEALPPVTSFLKDRYFPTNGQTDVFNTEEVLVDYKENGKSVAPFVLPNVGGTFDARSGFTTNTFSPPLIAPGRALTIDDLNKRGFGEAIFHGVQPATRQQLILMRDLQELDAKITRREEMMAAEVMMTNACVMTQYADAEGTSTREKKLQFHEGPTNPYEYTPTAGWDTAGAKIMADIDAMMSQLLDRGLPAEELVVAGDVAAVLINDPTIQKLLDITRLSVGNIAPLELSNGARHIGTLNIFGKLVKIIAYTETYEDPTTKKLTPFIPAGQIILTAPGAGRGLYGCVTQLELDNTYHSYTGRRVPHYKVNHETETRKVLLKSTPVLIPKVKGGWISAKVTGL